MPTTRFSSPLPVRRLAAFATLLLGVVLATATTACGPSNSSFLGVVFDTFTVYAINGTAPLDPSALNMENQDVVVPDGTLQFDVAFDIDSIGQPIMLPACAVATAFSSICNGNNGTRRVGMQRGVLSFDSVQYAPSTHYFFDSTMVMQIGHPIIIGTGTPLCATSSNPTLYGMVVLDSINTTLRTLYIRATIDPNCGYRSFLPGVPSR